jgi:hypothetical protein
MCEILSYTIKNQMNKQKNNLEYLSSSNYRSDFDGLPAIARGSKY